MLKRGNVAHSVLVESAIYFRITQRHFNHKKIMLINNMMVRYLIKKQQICKEIAFIQRKYSGLDVTLELWKRIFSDF